MFVSVIERDGVRHVTEGTWPECSVAVGGGWYRGGYDIVRTVSSYGAVRAWLGARDDAGMCLQCASIVAREAGE